MYKKGAGNDKQGKDVGNRTLCPYRNFSQAIMKNMRQIKSYEDMFQAIRALTAQKILKNKNLKSEDLAK